jgi:predicted phosphodiesterase
VPDEIVSVSSDEAVLLVDGTPRTYSGLPSSGTVTLDGLEVTTLPRPGERLSTVTTANDVHFGETVCGDLWDSTPTFSVDEDAEPYPTMMSRLAVGEMAALEPDAVIVKGDLTRDGLPEEYQAFLDCYQAAFDTRLTYVRGNHDCYREQEYAGWPFQEVHLEGAVIALLDTSRPTFTNGSISDGQLEQLDELAARVDLPVIVMGHHPIWDSRTEPRDDTVFSLLPEATEALLDVFARRTNLVTYAAGHTHRTHVYEIDGVPFVQVASLKDFPGAWCEYQIHDGGILQIVHRVLHPDALAWSELTRGMYSGAYGDYAYGSIDERCRLIDIRRV